MIAPEGRLAQLVDEATSLQRQHRLVEAERLFQAVLREDAGNFEALHRIGAILAEEGRQKEAVDYLQRALERNPESADAHYNLGIALTALGRPDDAMASYKRAIALDPDFAEAHTNLGNLLDAARLTNAAIASYRRALAIQPDLKEANLNLTRVLLQSGRRADVAEGYRQWFEHAPGDEEARYLYAVHSGKALVPRMPDATVERQFDQYAATFDARLHGLGYRGPQLVADALLRASGPPRGHFDVLDAGCGTGLGGPHLRAYARRLTGADLSSRMLERARATGLYDQLDKAELSAYLGGHPGVFDLIVAADVLIYFGPLETLLEAAFSALRPTGLLIFTVERAFDYHAPDGYRLHRKGRYSHSLAYLRRVLPAAGFGVLAIESATLRLETGQPVAGYVATCEKVARPGASARLRIHLHALCMSMRGVLHRRRRRRASTCTHK